MDFEYPTILRRYMATFIDGLLIIFLLIFVSYLLQDESSVVTGTRVILIWGLFFIYEPFCTSKLCTLGQKLMGVRIRQQLNLEKISLASAYIRLFIKIILGIISFLTIPFSKDRKAIHDFAARSIVIRAL
jgi:uncharacterized RDD family membrane protein YckC